MKKTVLVFGLIAGLIVTAMMLYSANMVYKTDHFKGSEILGYTTMLVAFSFLFVGIKNYRDKYNQGVISFGKAFKVGFFIALVASTMYVGVWLIEYYLFMPDFLERYSTCVIRDAQESGATPAQINEKRESMASYAKMYQTPVGVILLTYMEILPIGTVVALLCALFLKRKKKPAVQVA